MSEFDPMVARLGSRPPNESSLTVIPFDEVLSGQQCSTERAPNPDVPDSEWESSRATSIS